MVEAGRGTTEVFDLRDPAISIRECPACDEPLAARMEGENATTTCGYCGAPTILKAHPAASLGVAHAFRSTVPRNASGGRLPMGLSEPPASLAHNTSADALHATWRTQKHIVAEKGTTAESEHDYALLWLANKESERWLAKHDFVRTRAVLETALDLVASPYYRAILLARLSRLASRGSALELSKAWLALCPTGIRVAEVATEVRLAQGLCEHKGGNARGVLEVLGEDDAADTSVGTLRSLSIALRVDALERVGKPEAALAAWMAGSKVASVALSRVAKYYGLAAGTQRRVLQRGAVALTIVATALWSGASLATSVHSGQGSPLLYLLIFLGTLAAAVFIRARRGRHT